MATPSEVYYQLGEAVAAHLGVDFLIAQPKKGRPKGLATGMTLTLPIFLPTEHTRLGSYGSVDMVLLVTVANKSDVLDILDNVILWLRENRNTMDFELLYTEASPYYETGATSPELVGYSFDITCNI